MEQIEVLIKIVFVNSQKQMERKMGHDKDAQVNVVDQKKSSTIQSVQQVHEIQNLAQCKKQKSNYWGKNLFKIYKSWSLFHCEHVLKFVETSADHVDMFYCDKTKCKRQDVDEVALGKVSKGKVFRICGKKWGCVSLGGS